MLKGWSLMGDALAHSIVPGVAGAYMLGLPFAARRLRRRPARGARHGVRASQRTRLREDAIIGLVFTSFFAAGLLMVSHQSRPSVNVQSIVLGNILGISDEDAIQVVIIAVVSLAVLLLKWKDLMVVFFDESHARSVGLNPTCLKILFFTLLSACTVAALQTVGACLVIAMVVTPGATAYLLTDRFGRLLVHQRRDRRGDELRRRLRQLLPRRRDRRRHRRRCRRWCSSPPSVSRPSTACWRRGAGRRVATGDERHDASCRDFVRRCRLSYGFMQRALVVAVLVGAVCAVLSCYLVLKGWSLMGDAVSHAVLPGIVLAYRAGPAAGHRRLRRRPRLRAGDRLPQGEQPREGGHGDGHRVLRHVRLRPRALHQGRDRPALEPHPVRQHAGRRRRATSSRPAIIAGGTLLIVLAQAARSAALLLRPAACARHRPAACGLLHYGLLVLLSLTIVASLKAVGIILVVAMLVAPGAIAYLLSDRFERMLVIAAAVADRLERGRHARQLPHRRRDGPVHRADPDGRVSCSRSCSRRSAGCWTRGGGARPARRRDEKPRN